MSLSPIFILLLAPLFSPPTLEGNISSLAAKCTAIYVHELVANLSDVSSETLLNLNQVKVKNSN